ncbi:MAG: gliding motility-associated C-terminal domain-containing protein [Bacteroidota bacterium]
MRKILFLAFFVFISSLTFGQTYNMSTTSINTCSGVFYDPAGTGNYAINQNVIQTFTSSTPGQQISFSFIAWDFENNYDYLYVYDGTSTTSPALGRIGGHRTVGSITESDIQITSKFGSLTFRFYSDGSNVDAGWQANISCTTVGTCATPNNQDCLDAIPICGNSYYTTTSYTGQGNCSNEISGVSSCLKNGEKNDVWYVFNVQTAGNLTFSLTPNSSADDYDWAVYNLTNAVCTDIRNNPALEVSCNYALGGGSTGCASGNTLNSQWAGGTLWNAPIPVTVGQTYAINVSNYSSTQSGYTIDFSSASGVIVDVTPPAFQSITSSPSCGQNTITFLFSERVKCSTVSNGDFTVTGPGGPYTITNVNCNSGTTYSEYFTITLNTPLTAGGTYSLNLVGQVSDACNNPVSSNALSFFVSGVSGSAVINNHVSCNGGSNGSATASGSGGSSPYTYHWDNGINASNTTTLNAGTHYCTITDAGGICSYVVSVVITQPSALAAGAVTANQTVCNGGDPVAFSSSTAASGGAGTINYQWEYTTVPGCASGWTSIGGATASTYDPPSGITVTTCFRRKATDNCTSVYTTPVTVSIDAPTIGGAVSANATVCSGSNSGVLTLSGNTGSVLNWEYSVSPFTIWTPISNTTTTQAYTNLTQTTQFRAIVKNGTCVSQSSSYATITIDVAPSVTLSPISQTIGQGGTAMFIAAGTGTGLSYQWQYSPDNGASWLNVVNGGTNPTYSGALTSTLSMTDVQYAQNNYQYRCVISGTCSPAANTAAAILTVNASPAIVSHPNDSIICSGQNAIFTVAASGAGISYQWEVSTNGGATWTPLINGANYMGCTTNTLIILGAPFSFDGNVYHCVVTGLAPPTATSNSATITVVPGLPGTPTVPTGPTDLCVNSPNSIYNTTSTDASSYTWTISPPGAGVITGTTGSATVDWDNAFTGQATITVNGVNICGNGPPHSLTITISGAVPDLATTPAGPASLCMGTATSIYTATSTNATSYQWTLSPAGAGSVTGSGTSGTVSWNAGFTGTATLTVMGINGCGNGLTSSQTIIVSPSADQSITAPVGDVALCINSSNSSYTTTSSNTINYVWVVAPPAAGTLSGSGNSATMDWDNAYTGTVTIYVIGQNGCGSDTSDIITVDIDPMIGTPDTITGTMHFCSSPTVSTYTTSADNADDYTWSIIPNTAGTITGTGSTITVTWAPTAQDTIVIQVQANNNCGASPTTSAIVVVSQSIEGNVTNNGPLCEGDKLVLNCSASNVTSWIWSGPHSFTSLEQSPSVDNVVVSDSGYYTVLVANPYGCLDTFYTHVTIWANPQLQVVVSPGEESGLWEGQVVTLTAVPGGYADYTFILDGDTIHNGYSNVYVTSGLEVGDHTFTAYAENYTCVGLPNTLDIHIHDIPNVFTPNGDGKNDFFLRGINLKILDRWGMKMYEGEDGWDGRYDGTNVSPGTYYFIAKITDVDGIESVITGSVLVAR